MNLSVINRKTKFFFVATVIVCGIMFYAGLRPKGFRFHNEVAWITEPTGGIHFGKWGIAYTEHKAGSTNFLPDSVTIELAIKVPKADHGISPVIFYLWADHSPVSVYMIQWKNNLILRKMVCSWFRDKESEIGAAVECGKKHLLVITSCRNAGTNLFVDGVQMDSSSRLSLYDDRGNLQRLAVGNASDAASPWHGDIYSLSIYKGIISPDDARARYLQWAAGAEVAAPKGGFAVYQFDEGTGWVVHDRSGGLGDLLIPHWVHIPQKKILTMPWKDFRKDVFFLGDVAVNFIGFIPFGFFFFGLLRAKSDFNHRKQVTVTILSGGSMSLFFELTQVFVPTRTSQMSDLIANILGTSAGIFLYELIMPRLTSARHQLRN